MDARYFYLGLFVCVAGCSQKTNAPLQWREVASPAGPGSNTPNLFTATDGRIFLNWTAQLADKRHALRFAVYENGGWTTPQTIAEGDNWFVNWADFPSLVAFADGALAAHWLAKSGEGTYAYNVNIALSKDAGKNWGNAILPHRDGTPTEHGFVSMLPWQDDRALVVWLDGRNFAQLSNGHHETAVPTEEMTLRRATLDKNGEMHDEALLDARVCECCQTDAALTANGAVVVYRDRSMQEIRDIGIVRFHNGSWTEPKILHADNWEHHGCPVNGPAVAANGAFVAVAWYTAAQDTPHVRLAFSNDEGATFGQPIEVGGGDPIGRVDLILLPDNSALVSWMEQMESDGEIRVRRVRADGWRSESQTVAQSSAKRASGFPRMARHENEIVIAWTQVGDPSTVRTAATKLQDNK
ncbi:glycoside hydrolase [candidate division KSB1 bacterium]|nr:glycoside hydrolase [candidate division KSB1 bacterium]